MCEKQWRLSVCEKKPGAVVNSSFYVSRKLQAQVPFVCISTRRVRELPKPLVFVFVVWLFVLIFSGE